MQFIKFSDLQSAQEVCNRVFTEANSEGVFINGASFYSVPIKEEYYTVPVFEGFEKFFTEEELNSGEILTEERKGRKVIDDLMQQINFEKMDVADASTYFNRMVSVIVMLQAGNLKAAKRRAEEVTTTTVYSQIRKSWLIDRIQKEL